MRFTTIEKLALVLFVTGALLALFFGIPKKSANNTPRATLYEIQIGEAALLVEIADTPEKRTLGLSGRASLKENEGLLFVFEHTGIYPFWMKDMHFPIDIIWIGENRRVVGVTENISPDSFPKIFPPPAPVRYVIEVNAGWTQKAIVTVGEKIVSLSPLAPFYSSDVPTF